MGNANLKNIKTEAYTPFHADIIISQEQVLQIYPDVKIIPCPGHTKGSIGILADKLYFSGDLFMNLAMPSTLWFAAVLKSKNFKAAVPMP